MPPTIQTNLNADRDKRPQRTAEKRSELVCKVKYCNTLPDIPFDPKFITYPFESRRFIEYNPTSLERNYKYEVLTEHDLGVTIDLINKDLYTPDYNKSLDPADEKLLEEDVLTPQDSKRSRHHGMSVSWLRRTEYISTEQTRFQPQTMDKVEAKVGYSIKKNFKDETLYMDRESQIKAIEKTFTDSKQPVEKHYSKPNVYPVEVLPVFPDFKLWKYPCAQVIFDSDPAPVGRPIPAQIEEMSNAMIRGVMDESGEQFVAYFLPTETTLEKRRNDLANNVEYTEDEEYEYKMAREYNWNVKSKASKGYEENYFLVMRQGDGAYYNELETRVRLSKRRQKAGQQANNTRLVVQHRTLNAQEFKMQRYRERLLEPPNEEEEEEEEQNLTKSDDERVDRDKKSGSEREDSDKEQDNENERNDGDKENNDSENERVNGEKEDSDQESDRKKKIDEIRRSSSGSGSGSENDAMQKKTGSNYYSALHTNRSRSPSGSPSRSVRRSASGSPRRSVSGSPHPSRSSSPQRRSATGSPSRSVSGSPKRSASRTPRRSISASPRRSRSASGSLRRSVSGSPRRSASRTPRRSASGSPRRSASGSPPRSASESPSATRQSPSLSGSGSGSASESE